jgi:hypothetical protein
MFLDVPPVQKSPMSQRFPDALSHETKTIQDWGSRLANLTSIFQKNHPDATIIEFSTYKVLDAILDKPSVYAQTASLKNVTGFCDNPRRYSFHLLDVQCTDKS